jgi:hypothetical protein
VEAYALEVDSVAEPSERVRELGRVKWSPIAAIDDDAGVVEVRFNLDSQCH